MKLGCNQASCILRPCNTDNDNLCEPYGFALNDKSGAFHTYFSAACEVEMSSVPLGAPKKRRVTYHHIPLDGSVC